MKIGVVGTGLAGLTAAYLLSQQHDVTVFEKNHTIGFDSHSMDIKIGIKEYRIDVPLRVFDEKHYKNLSAFYSQVGIKYERGNYCQSYGYTSGNGADASDNEGSIYFRYYNQLFGSYSLPFVKGLNVFDPMFMRIIIGALRLYILAPFHMRDKQLEQMAFGEYLKKYNYSPVFVKNILLPAVSAMCTCTYEHAQNYPALMLLTYFTQRALNGMRRVTGGSREVIRKLSSKFSRVHCNAAVAAVYPSTTQKGKVVVVDNKWNEHVFDHVIMATQANHAKNMLTKAPKPLLDILNSFEYVKGSAFVHTDENLMPKSKTDWGNVHFGFIEDSPYPVASIWLNSILSSLRNDGADNVFQTIFPSPKPIDTSKLLGTMNFERPIMNAASVKAMQSLVEYQGADNIWFCGAHVVYGVPLLENAVKSGMYVAKRLGCEVPWEETEIPFCPQTSPLPAFLQLRTIGSLLFVLLLSVMFIWVAV